MKPEVKEYVNQYVRAVYDFDTNHPKEINLHKGDIIRVTSAVDSNWLCGQLRDQEGNFPSSFVEKLSLPAVKENQKIFGAIENFPALQHGDLEFRKGAVIIGLHPVDENWWSGQIGSKEGIFPLTHVIELEIPSTLRDRSKSCHSAEPLFAQALCDSVAQLDEELSFTTGDIITVTEVIDSDWYYGELGSKKGMFLSSCVQLLQDDDTGGNTPQEKTESNDRQYGSPNDKSNLQYLQKSYSFDQSYYGNLSTGDTIKQDLTTAVDDAVFNKPYSNSAGHLLDSPQNSESYDSGISVNTNQSAGYSDPLSADNAAYTSENTKSVESSVNPYGVAQFPFAGQSDDELSFEANEIIYLIQHIDEQWTEGEIDGKIGIFPTSFVSVIVDCPYAYSEQKEIGEDFSTSGAQKEKKSEKSQVCLDTQTFSSGKEKFALVLHSFLGELEGDLKVEQGDTVTVVERVDENWIKAKNETGEVGLCPKQFVEILSEGPSSIKALPENSTENEKEVNLPDTQNVQQSHAPVTKDNLKTKETLINETPKSALPSTARLKPQLGPKPMLKPKPKLLPKPALGQTSPLKPKTFDMSVTGGNGFGSLHKSSSVQSLDIPNQMSDLQTVRKSASTLELHDKYTKGEENGTLEIQGESDIGLNDMISAEMSKAKAESFDRPVSAIDPKPNSVPPLPLNQALSVMNTPKRHSVNFPISDSIKHDRPRNNAFSSSTKLASKNKSQYCVGQSTFFVEAEEVKKVPPMRRPPPIPQRSFETEHLFDRKPSLRKAPPPRPMGPRIAPAPSKEPMMPEKVEPVSRKVPQRPAPARPIEKAPNRPQDVMRPPKRPPPRAPTIKEQGENLMRFSPEKDDNHDEANEEVIADLRRQIQETEMDLEKCKKSRDEIQSGLTGEDPEEDEVRENIAFYDANIVGLSEELNKLKENLERLSPEERDLQVRKRLEEERKAEEEKRKEEERKMSAEMKAKRHEKREKVIEELLQTEKDFLQGLSLCMEIFVDPGAEKHPEVDTDLLLGNMEDIADVSQRLLTQLEAAIQGKEFDQQVIGTCFVTLADDLKNAYAPYCRNHDSVITLIEKYKEDPSISAFLQSQLDKLRERCVVFDLEAILIKPVQRILKYPLLLNELFKCTEDDHPDKHEILAGINAMTDVASAINEYKRRKDLVYKYKKETDASFGDKLAKLNFHTIKKKGSRFRGRISTNLGFSPQTRDENFENEETRFRQLEKVVKIFVRDVQTFTTQIQMLRIFVFVQDVQQFTALIQDSVSFHENLVADIIDFYDDKQQSPTVQQFQQAQQKIDNTFLPEFLENVSVLVVSPLTKLTQMFDGPVKVIQKRYDKLLDYDNLLRKGKDEKATEKSLSKAKADYEALNAQLLDELPKLYSLSLTLLQDCVTSFVRAQQEYANRLFLHMSDLLDKLIKWETSTINQSGNKQALPSLLTQGENVVETFNIQHVAMVDRLSMLSFIPKGFNPKLDAAVKSGDKKPAKRQSLVNIDTTSPQLDSQKVFLRQRYGPDQLFRVMQSYTAIDMMDLSLQEGDLVGVVMKKDPMGNKERWFVDNANTKGFVPSYILQLPHSSPQQSHSQLYPSIGQTDVPSSPLALSPQNLNVSPSPPGQYSNRCTTSSSQNAHHTSSPIGQTPTSPKIVPPIGEDELSEELDEMLNEDMTPEISSDYSHDSYIPECEEFYYAEYAFDARNSNEMTMFEGQVVTVLAKHDEEHNTDWWYVDADGHRGYAPAAYLKPMS